MYSYEKEPMEILIPVPNGTYEITLSVTASEDTVFTVLAQTRRIMLRDVQIKRGEKHSYTFAVSVCDHNVRECGVEIRILCDGGLTAAAAVSMARLPQLYVCGGSDAADYPAEYPYDPASARCGWGQAIPQFFDEGIAVSNRSHSGFTTADLDLGALNIRCGDAVLVQLDSDCCAERLRRLADKVQGAGGHIIFFSPISGMNSDEYGHIKSSAADMDIPFMDMHRITAEVFAKPLFLSDGTYTNDIGGELAAKLMAKELLKIDFEPLAKHIKADILTK